MSRFGPASWSGNYDLISTPEDAIILIVVCLIIATVLKELICTFYIPQMHNLNDNMEVWSVLKFFQQQCLRQTICWALNLVTTTAFTNKLCTEFHATGPLWSKSLICSCSRSRHNVYASSCFFLVYSSILSSVSTCQLGRSLSLSLSLSLSRFPRLVECGLQFASRLMHTKIIKPGGVGGIRISWHTWQTNHSNPRRSLLQLPRRHLSGPWLRLRVHQLSYTIMSISLAHQHLHTALPLSSAAAHLQLLIIPFHHQLPVVAERALSCTTELYY